MKAYFDNAEYNRYYVVQLQALFFLVGYHAYMETRSLTKTIGALIGFVWLSNSFYNLHVVFTGLIGLALAIVTTLVHDHDHVVTSTYIQLYYYIIQPGILYFVLPLYIDQTEFPLGVFVGAVLWLGCNGIVWIGERNAHRWKNTTTVILAFLPVFSIFLFSAVLSRRRWLPLSISVGVQLFCLAINIAWRFSLSQRRERA